MVTAPSPFFKGGKRLAGESQKSGEKARGFLSIDQGLSYYVGYPHQSLLLPYSMRYVYVRIGGKSGFFLKPPFVRPCQRDNVPWIGNTVSSLHTITSSLILSSADWLCKGMMWQGSMSMLIDQPLPTSPLASALCPRIILRGFGYGDCDVQMRRTNENEGGERAFNVPNKHFLIRLLFPLLT